jgi:hypothetical protein
MKKMKEVEEEKRKHKKKTFSSYIIDLNGTSHFSE